MNRAELLPPKDGITYTLDDIFLENKRHERPPVKYWLFMDQIIGEQRRRIVYEITTVTEEQADAELTQIADRADVAIIDSEAPRQIEKRSRRRSDREIFHGRLK